MTAERPSGSGDPLGASQQMWDAGARALADGWRQSQEFWNSAARSWGEAAGAWMGQLQSGSRSQEHLAVARELQEAAFAVGQAWMRLPLALAGGAQPAELQQAITKLAEAQGRAYQLWMEALSRAGATMAAGARPPGGERR